MTTVEAAVHRGKGGREGHQFTTRISNELFEEREVQFQDRKVTGAQLAEGVGAYPSEEWVILRQLETFELEAIRPTELVDLADGPLVFVIKGSQTFRFTVDGRSLEWPLEDLTGLEIKTLVGKEDDDIDLILEREDQPDKVVDDDDTVRIGKEGLERFKIRPAKGALIISVDGEPFEAPRRIMTPNQIIVEAAQKDPSTHHLARITKKGTVSYQGKGDEPIRLRRGMKFQVISTGPTPVSDPLHPAPAQLFKAGLSALGYEPQSLPSSPDHITFSYVVETGKYRGTTVTLGLVVPSDFPMTPPSGRYVSPSIHPINTSGEHPRGAVHKEQARVFDAGTGLDWQYWSRPFPNWPASKRTVATYMSRIWKLWDSQ